MKTILSQFCEEFEHKAQPLLEPIDLVCKKLAKQSSDTPSASLLPGLLNVQHQLKTLIEKVAEQQAYVIIFGPLKSGKSTLMNALAAEYVSEVTSLPAYPCMVYAGHAPKREIAITRYDGSVEAFPDGTAMRKAMETAHAALADRVRAVEQQGESFEPGQHMPEAIRRVDVRMPAEQLAESGAILVDTPGLYSRMRFGYDLMTREFRDTAASAVFVVKTDNLFLEQVFDEFNELLQLFSRIFLVVNIDSTKRDLQPNGELGPSLEREDPQRIVDAFERLSMNAELKRAWDDGRLGIYPVDLLQAASQRLRNNAGDDDPATPTDDFDAFEQSLTEYLNSNDYMVAFLGDSLRQATALTGELRDVAHADPVVGIAREVEKLSKERDAESALLVTITRLKSVDWTQSFDALSGDFTQIAHECIDAVKEKTTAAGDACIDAWFENEDSYSDLVQRDLANVLASCRQEIVETMQNQARTTLTAREFGGAKVETATLQDARNVGFTLPLSSVEAALKTHDSSKSLAAGADISPEIVSVSRTLWDFLLLRSGAAARQRLLGPDDEPSLTIPAYLKKERLGDSSREALHTAFQERLERFYTESLQEISGQVFASYKDAMSKQISTDLSKKHTQTKDSMTDKQAKLDARKSLTQDLGALEVAARAASEAIEDLTNRYRETDPQALTEPVEES